MDREVKETLGTFINRIEEVALPFHEGVLRARDVKVPVLLDGIDNKVVKTPIAWPLLDYKMFYKVNVPAGTEIPEHKHDESIFRILISGDLTINNMPIEVGEWFVVQNNTNYSIKTVDGYTSVVGYTSNCRTNRMSDLHLEVQPDSNKLTGDTIEHGDL